LRSVRLRAYGELLSQFDDRAAIAGTTA
jgi:hypothetical protein